MLTLTSYGARRLGFGREDRITIIFCGSKKSLASGLPMAAVLFGAQASLLVLPLMLFHQMQLMVCAVLAKRWQKSAPSPRGSLPGDLPAASGPPLGASAGTAAPDRVAR
jgi:sodium/bile acid cotransporter 7